MIAMRNLMAWMVVVGNLVVYGGAKLLSIDLGSESLKVAAIAPRSVGVVTNEMSKRKTPALVGFSQGERLIGEPAAVKAGLYPDRIVPYARDLLGVLYQDSHELRNSLWKERYLPIQFVQDPERGTVRFRMGQGEEYAAEELVAMILEYAKGIGEAQLESKVSDVVLTVPAWFGQSQRAALLDAANLAGLNTLALINSYAAAALQYGIEKDFTNKTEHVVLYDMGANSVEVAHVKFSSFVVKEGYKNNTYSQFETMQVKWDSDTGAEDLDVVLMNHFADEFEALHPGTDIRGSPRAMAKLKRECKRTKEILSANSDAPLNVESLHNDLDFRTSITRVKFEELAGDFFEKAALPLKKLIDGSGLTPDDFSAVELLGGGTRVPGVRQALEKVLVTKGLDRHLDADEAAVLGAALHAANISTSFRLRKFGMSDIATFDLLLEQEIPTKDEASKDSKAKRVALVSQDKRILPLKKTLTMKEQYDDFSISVHYSTKDGAPLPRGVADPLVGRYTVVGVSEAGSSLKNSTYLGKTNVLFSIGYGGSVSVEKVEAAVQMSETVKVPVLKHQNETKPMEAEGSEGDSVAGGDGEKAEEDPKDAADDGASGDQDPEGHKEDGGEEGTAAEAAENSGEKNKTVESPQFEMQEQVVTRVTRIPLQTKHFMRVPAMGPEAMQAAVANLDALRRKDKARQEAAAAKNDLESYILKSSSMLQGDEDVLQVSTEEEREQLSSRLLEAEDWLYMDGADAEADEFSQRLRTLKAPCEAVFHRASELTKRPEAVERARAYLSKAKEMVQSWETAKPWINATDREQALHDLDGYEGWLEESIVAQQKQPLTQEPAFTSAQVDAKLAPLQKKIEKLKKTKKPKPPPQVTKENETSDEGRQDQDAESDGTDGSKERGDATAGDDADAAREDASSPNKDPHPKDEL